MAARKTTGTGKQTGGEVEAGIEQLYALPPGQFAAARKQLAAKLRQAGRGAAAERVSELVKPTPSVWAINLLLRQEGERVAALLAAGERARATQQRLLSGKAGAEALQGSAKEVRALVELLRRRAVELASAAGLRVGALTRERIEADLEAMALDPAGAGAVAGGWLERDLDRPGLNVLAGARLPPGARRELAAAPAQAQRPAERLKAQRPAERLKAQRSAERLKPGPPAARKPSGHQKPERRPQEERRAAERQRAERREAAVREQRARQAEEQRRAAERRERQAAAARERIVRAERAVSAAGAQVEKARREAEEAARAEDEASRKATQARTASIAARRRAAEADRALAGARKALAAAWEARRAGNSEG
jgi:hypothetical protein